MKSIEGNKIIVTLQKDLIKNGLKVDALIKGFKAIRPYALEDEDPTVVKVSRLVYEEAISTEELEEGEEPEMIISEIETDDDRVESIDYLLSLMLDRDNDDNKQDLFAYRDALKEY